MLDNSKFWQRFRLAAILILIPVLLGGLVFLVIFFWPGEIGGEWLRKNLLDIITI